MDTILPVVQKPSESTQIPLALSLKMDIIVSAVICPTMIKNLHENQRRKNINCPIILIFKVFFTFVRIYRYSEKKVPLVKAA